MLIHVSPWWLEVWITGTIALVVYVVNADKRTALARSLTALPSDIEQVKDWVVLHLRRYRRLEVVAVSWAVPCGEEALCRGLPVAIMRYDPAWWLAALIIGLLVNVVFATSHKGMPSGYFQAEHRHQIAAYILGMAALGASMWTGLLITAIAVHALSNIVLGGSIATYLANRNTFHVQVAGRHYTLCLKAPGTC